MHVKFSEIAVVLLSKICRSKTLMTYQNFIRTFKIHYKKEWFFHKIFDNSHLVFRKTKEEKIKTSILDRP